MVHRVHLPLRVRPGSRGRSPLGRWLVFGALCAGLLPGGLWPRAARAEAAMTAGVARDRIWLDPGIGFGKTVAHNLALIRRL